MFLRWFLIISSISVNVHLIETSPDVHVQTTDLLLKFLAKEESEFELLNGLGKSKKNNEKASLL